MLVLRRKDGQWLEIVHRSGDVLRMRVYDIKGDAPPRVNLAFDDTARHFEIHRPERRRPRSGWETLVGGGSGSGTPVAAPVAGPDGTSDAAAPALD